MITFTTGMRARNISALVLASMLTSTTGCHSVRPSTGQKVVETECFDSQPEAEDRLIVGSEQIGKDGIVQTLRGDLVGILGPEASRTGELLVTCCRRLVDSKVCASHEHPFDIVFTTTEKLTAHQVDEVRAILGAKFSVK